MMPDGMFEEYVESSINGTIQAVIELYLDLKNDPKFRGKQSAIVKEIASRLEIGEPTALQALELHQEGFDRLVAESPGLERTVVDEFLRMRRGGDFPGTRPAINIISVKLGLPESFVLMALERSGERIWDEGARRKATRAELDAWWDEHYQELIDWVEDNWESALDIVAGRNSRLREAESNNTAKHMAVGVMMKTRDIDYLNELIEEME